MDKSFLLPQDMHVRYDGTLVQYKGRVYNAHVESDADMRLLLSPIEPSVTGNLVISATSEELVDWYLPPHYVNYFDEALWAMRSSAKLYRRAPVKVGVVFVSTTGRQHRRSADNILLSRYIAPEYASIQMATRMHNKGLRVSTAIACDYAIARLYDGTDALYRHNIHVGDVLGHEISIHQHVKSRDDIKHELSLIIGGRYEFKS